MYIKAYYPSGYTLHLSGEWKGCGNLNGKFGVVVIVVDKDYPMPGGPILQAHGNFIGDIRGVYLDESSGDVLYNPREHMKGMNKWAVDWLGEHPEWPALLEL